MRSKRPPPFGVPRRNAAASDERADVALRLQDTPTFEKDRRTSMSQRLDRHALTAYRWSCATQPVIFRRRSPVGAPGRRSDGPYCGTHPLQVTQMRAPTRERLPSFFPLARVGPTHRRVPQPGRARNRQGASQAGSCQTANDGSDKSGMGVPRSIETRNKTHACMALRWNETKKNTVLRIRMGRDQGRGRCLVALA